MSPSAYLHDPLDSVYTSVINKNASPGIRFITDRKCCNSLDVERKRRTVEAKVVLPNSKSYNLANRHSHSSPVYVYEGLSAMPLKSDFLRLKMLVVEEEVGGGAILRWSLLFYIFQIEPNASPEQNSNLGSTAADGLAWLNARK